MTIAIKHAKVSAKTDSGDATLIQPSDWNAGHTITLAQSNVLGRSTGSDGAMEELPIAVDGAKQSMMPPGGTTAQRPASPLASMIRYNTDLAALEAYIGGAWVSILTTAQAEPAGKIGYFLTAAAPSGWVKANGGTVGDASSGASRANADTSALFAVLWALDVTVSPILTSAGGASTRGANAAADFAAHKRLTVPDLRGQFLRGLDDGRGVDVSRLLGSGQADATAINGLTVTATSSASSSFAGSAMTPHAHNVTRPNATGYDGFGHKDVWANGDGEEGSNTVVTASVSAGTPAGSVSTSVTTTPTVHSTDTETRPTNSAGLVCVKL